MVAAVDTESVTSRLRKVRVGDEPELTWQKAVPKGFRLFMSVPHASQNGNLRHRNDTQRTFSKLESASAPRGFPSGFDPAELIRKNALHPDVNARFNLQCSTLENEIHPIFGHSNFIDCPKEVYEIALMPGLRLASMMLLSRATSTFWFTLAFGKRQPFLLNAQTGEHAVRIREDVRWTEDDQRRFEDRLSKIRNHVRFYFDIETPNKNVYGSCFAPCAHRRFVLPLDAINVRHAQIYINSDFYTTAVRLSKTKHPDPYMVLRFNFLLAVTLLHEAAHFVEFSHSFEYTSDPYLNDEEWAEVGCAFEQKTFGGIITSINDRVDCAYGLCIADRGSREQPSDEADLFWSIPMEYIIKVQQQSTWLEPHILEDTKAFHISRDGARSCDPVTFSMQVWDDEADPSLADVVDTGIVLGARSSKLSGRSQVDSRVDRVIHGRVDKVVRMGKAEYVGKGRRKQALGKRGEKDL